MHAKNRSSRRDNDKIRVTLERVRATFDLAPTTFDTFGILANCHNTRNARRRTGYYGDARLSTGASMTAHADVVDVVESVNNPDCLLALHSSCLETLTRRSTF
ncbi:unnamed protein product [Lasius platythorax]|uniref:Uncharacterized protein n=1 Tax=Lasius platythorax TaxID=488582 RepID=A0AAV2P2A0_9HYME